MSLVYNWKDVLRHAVSIRWMLAMTICGFGELVTYLFEPPQSFWLRLLLAIGVAISGPAGIFSRIMFQHSLSGDDKNG